MLSQRLIIRLLPLEVLFAGGLILGWTAMNVSHLPSAPLASEPVVEAAPVEVVAAPAPPTVPDHIPALAPFFTAEVQRWGEQIRGWAAQYGVDPNLIATVMQIESCGWRSAVSKSNAQGLFQVMPFHFAPGEPMQDPDVNAYRGLAYLSLGLTRANGDIGLALAGYNGGHSLITRDPAGWPEQTKRYWYWGTGLYNDAASGQATSGRLQEWLQAGGASLCARAAQEQ
ncbi:MAG: transglycosylase SLT domain-containing protein [Anaerolineales bacterium]